MLVESVQEDNLLGVGISCRLVAPPRIDLVPREAFEDPFLLVPLPSLPRPRRCPQPRPPPPAGLRHGLRGEGLELRVSGV